MPRLGQWLRERMKQEGLTQKDVEARTGVSQSLISVILRYAHVPAADTLIKLADGLGEDRATVFALAGLPINKPDAPQLDVSKLAPEIRALLEQMEGLPPSLQEEVARRWLAIAQAEFDKLLSEMADTETEPEPEEPPEDCEDGEGCDEEAHVLAFA